MRILLLPVLLTLGSAIQGMNCIGGVCSLRPKQANAQPKCTTGTCNLQNKQNSVANYKANKKSSCKPCRLKKHSHHRRHKAHRRHKNKLRLSSNRSPRRTSSCSSPFGYAMYKKYGKSCRC